MPGAEAVNRVIEEKINQLKNMQKPDGSWRFCFEGPPMTDAYFIIMAKSLNLNEESLIQKCVQRLKENQEKSGVWLVYPDEANGNLSATVEATIALALTSNIPDSLNQRTYDWIKQNGGLKRCSLITRAFLALNGLYPWPSLPVNPSWLVLLPKSSPVNFFSFSSYARAHFAPTLAACGHLFKKTPKLTPTLYSLYTHLGESVILEHTEHRSDNYNKSFEPFDRQPVNDPYWPEIDLWLGARTASFWSTLTEALFKLKADAYIWESSADRWIERYILNRISSNGTFLSYASTTYLMIYGLLALGYSEHSPIILKAIEGIKSLIWEGPKLFHIQNSPSPIWDTALISVAFLDSGLSVNDPALKKSAAFLKDHQHAIKGDWSVHNPDSPPGGWGFEDTNVKHPDNDDTHVVLRVMAAFKKDPIYDEAFRQGLNWLLTMQNTDGGWAAFEKNVDQEFLALFPVEHMSDAALDLSTPDLTGRTLFMFGKTLKWTSSNKNAERAIRWLKNAQEKEGAWSGRWGVQKIYGTWAALTGLCSVGLPKNDSSITKAVKWLESIQNEDGGWGESCRTDEYGNYSPHKSTSVQTAWAVDALLSALGPESLAVKRGIQYLLKTSVISYEEELTSYPTGIGLPRSFYVRYHSYPYIWPLMTLSHYKQTVKKR